MRVLIHLLIALFAVVPPTFAAPNYFSPDCAIANDFYSDALASAREPSHIEQRKVSPDVETYRLTLHPSFLSRTVSRIEIHPSIGGRAFSYESVAPGLDALSDQKTLKPNDIKQIRATFAGTDFWSMSSVVPCVGCRDGTMWLIEVVKDGKYHCVERWSPKATAFKKLGLVLLKFSGLDDPDGPRGTGVNFKKGDASLYEEGQVVRTLELNESQLKALLLWLQKNIGPWPEVRTLVVPVISLKLIFASRYPANLTLTSNSVVLNFTREKELSEVEMQMLRKLIGVDGK